MINQHFRKSARHDLDDLRLQYFELCASSPHWRQTAVGLEFLRRLTGQRINPPEAQELLFASPESIMAYWDLCDVLDFGSRELLILGESGVGKEGFAQIAASRKELALVPVNCATLVESIAEAQLFGVAPGAAVANVGRQGTPGLVSSKDPQVIFLDEFFDAPVAVLPKLLRLLQQRTYYRVGSWEENQLPAGTLLIAASNRYSTRLILQRAIDDGQVRQDLIDRFAAIVEIPPLRDRKDEIPALAMHLVRKIQADRSHAVPRLFNLMERAANAVRDARCEWRGNVRELKRFLEEQIRFRRHDQELESLTIPDEAVDAWLTRKDAVEPETTVPEFDPLSAWKTPELLRLRERQLIVYLKGRALEASESVVNEKWVAKEVRRALGAGNASQYLKDNIKKTCKDVAEMLNRELH